jgi:predicted nucleotidyltransferase
MLPLCDPKRYPLLEEYKYPLLFVTISGSHLYGFSSPDSDIDLRGAHAAWTEELVGLCTPKQTLERMEGDNDIVTHEIGKFCLLALKNSGYCLEQAMSPLVVITSGWFADLREILPRCVTKKHTKHYLGFTNSQLSILRRKPDKQIKVILYMFRALMTGIHFARTRQVEANILTLNETFKFTFIDELVREKIEGKEKAELAAGHSLEFYMREQERLLAQLECEISASSLPEELPDTVMAELNRLLIRLRRFHWKNPLPGGGIILAR